MKKMLYVGLFFSYSALAVVEKAPVKEQNLSRFRAPASIIEREHLAQRAEKNIELPNLELKEKPLVNPAAELPVRVKQLTPGGTSE
jgi:hypothetical protein